MLFRSERWRSGLASGTSRPAAAASPERLGVLIIQVSTGALSRWVVNIVDIDTFEQESRFGLAACLLPFATDRGRAILQARLREAEAALAAPRLKELPAS